MFNLFIFVIFHLQNSLFACLSEGAEFEYAGTTDVELEVMTFDYKNASLITFFPM